MALLFQKINYVAEWLVEVPALPRDTLLLILNCFTHFGGPYFVGPFELMLDTYRVIQLDNYGDRHDDKKCLERVKNLTLLASNSFPSLTFSNHWNIPCNHQHVISKGKVPCGNCGVEHYSLDFPHPHDEAKIKKSK